MLTFEIYFKKSKDGKDFGEKVITILKKETQYKQNEWEQFENYLKNLQQKKDPQFINIIKSHLQSYIIKNIKDILEWQTINDSLSNLDCNWKLTHQNCLKMNKLLENENNCFEREFCEAFSKLSILYSNNSKSVFSQSIKDFADITCILNLTKKFTKRYQTTEPPNDPLLKDWEKISLSSESYLLSDESKQSSTKCVIS